MDKLGLIMVIDDDEDDRFLFSTIFDNLNLPYDVIFFDDGDSALDFLNNSDILPFIILSDVRMPKLDGFELKQKFKKHATRRLENIPYIFFSTSLSEQLAIQVYSDFSQGLFVKPDSSDDFGMMLRSILEYWKICSLPIRNEFENVTGR